MRKPQRCSMNNSWGAVQDYELLRQHEDSTAASSDRDSSSQPLQHQSSLRNAAKFPKKLQRCVKISPFVSTSRIRSDGTGLSDLFDYVLQSVAPNKERASCWEKNSCLVLVPSAEAWLLSTKAFGLTQAEPSRIRRGCHIHRSKSSRISFVLLQRKKSENVCEDVGGGLCFL